MRSFFTFLLLCSFFTVFAQNQTKESLLSRFEKSQGSETVTYEEGIEYFQQLAETFDFMEIREMGLTDSGEPLHLLIFDTDRDFDFAESKAKGKTVLLINNAIHPGEPDGVDASMMLLRDLAQNRKARRKLKNTVVAVIPFYNIGGALNRNSTSRANQNGPTAYGFRGNARNYDLNRDFIKNDSRNARSFSEIYHLSDPDIYVETHVSNGADYQYVMTLLATQHNKLGGVLGNFLHEEMMPELFESMEKKKHEMTPYVNVWGTVPDSGYVQFMDYPRYSSGYTTLFSSLGFITETHMLKPYKDRVAATYAFLESTMEFADEHGKRVQQVRAEQRQNIQEQKTFALDWQVDTSRYTTLNFKGYESRLLKSEVSGLSRLYYDREKPFEKEIEFYNFFKGVDKVEKPRAYVIPQGWHEVIALLKQNGVQMREVEKDTSLQVEAYRISDWKSRRMPYEGHFRHEEVQLEKRQMEVTLRKGDYLIPTGQAADRYLVETLEPKAPDSYFRWNFFDTILQQKEHFSPYVFEDKAAEMLENNPQLRQKLEQRKAQDKKFAQSAYAQLNFIYMNSPHYEQAHLLYPVYRLK